MHRVNDPGDGFADGFYHDQALPDAGTVDRASEANSEMMELCNLVTLAGDTLAPDAATDEANGWRQCYDAIFQNGHLTDSAIDELSFAVLKSGAINITVGTEAWYQDVTGLGYSDTANDSSVAIGNGVSNAKYQGARTYYDGRGIRYQNGPGDSIINDVYFRRAHYPISMATGTWSEFQAGSGTWEWSEEYTTDLPSSYPVYNVFARTYNNSTGRWSLRPFGCQIEAVGGFWVLKYLALTNGRNSIQVDTLQVTVEYDAINLTVP